jgi:hypothetical protein
MRRIVAVDYERREPGGPKVFEISERLVRPAYPAFLSERDPCRGGGKRAELLGEEP